MGVEAFIAEPAIERFHERIVGRLARPREVQRNAVLMGPPTLLVIWKWSEMRSAAFWLASLLQLY